MVFEEIFNVKKIINNPVNSLYLGVFFALFSFLSSQLLFFRVPQFIGIGTILLTLALSIPVSQKILKYEVKQVRKASFFKQHKKVIDFYLYFFIGTFITFFIISLIFPGKIFSEAQLYGKASSLESIITDKQIPPPPSVGKSEIVAIFQNNLFVMILCFILSLFYGSGALFLIILNASIFASTLSNLLRVSIPQGFLPTYTYIACNLSVLLFHAIPEVIAYLMAAVAGGLLSLAIVRKEKYILKILKTSTILVILSILFLLLSAFIEVNISKTLVLKDICSSEPLVLLAGGAILLSIILIFEYWRKNHKFK